MATMMPDSPVATEGKRSAAPFHAELHMETTGKRVAVNCLNAAIESFLVAREMSRAQLAEDICGTSEGNFSKIVNGVQGDFWALVYRLPGDIRADFYDRLHETEHTDPLIVAMEQLHVAMFRVLRLTGAASLPEKARQMAKAAVRERKQRSA